MSPFFLRYTSFIVSLLCCILLPLQAPAELPGGDCISTAWPHEHSDLQPDPELSFGRLDNGFRYVLMKNSDPKDRVALFLDVQVGSINEEDHEQGVAHFLEHMLFNGSANFNPGELVDYFQSLGMSFGGDTNAHTTYTETVYKIILPKGTRSELEKGLLVMSDFASGALLLENEVERERGVILAEKTARDSAGYRAHLAKISFLMDGTKIPKRKVIGSQAVLSTAGSDLLKNFYHRWYRPENMVLVMVGDFNRKDAEELVRASFKSMKRSAIPPECPDYGSLNEKDSNVFYHFEPEQGYTQVSIEVIEKKARQRDSFALQREHIQQVMASRIINYRLENLVDQPGTVFSEAHYFSGDIFDRFKAAGIRATAHGGKWQETLAEMDRIVRQVLAFGFTDQELARVRDDFLNEIKDAVLTRDTRNSLTLATKIIDHLNSDRVLQSPEQEARLYTPVIRSVSARELHEQFKQDWQNREWLITVVGNAKLPGAEPERYLKEFTDTLKTRDIQPPLESADIPFPYLSGANGSIEPVQSRTFELLGAKRFTYANGLIVNFKKTDFKENMVRVAIDFGDGQESGRQPGLELLATSVVNGSGTATLKRSALERVISGSSVQYTFQVGEDSFSWEGYSLVNDVELLFQVLQAVQLDPGLRPEAYDRAMKAAKLMYQRMERDIYGKLRTRIEPFFGDYAVGFGLPEWSLFQEFTLSDVSDWLTPYFKEAPLEISVVGDIDEERVVQLVSTYFGSIDERHYQRDYEKTVDFPAGRRLEVPVDSSFDKSVVRMAWLTDDFWDISRTRRLHLLAAVLEDRLRKVIRESLGSSYSPSVYSVTSRIHRGFGMLVAEVVVDAALVDSVQKEIADLVASLRENGVEEEELNRAKSPFLTSLKETYRTNRYWLNSVLSLSSRHPEQLSWPLQMIDDFQSITSEDLNALARAYLVESRRATGVVRAEDKTGQ